MNMPDVDSSKPSVVEQCSELCDWLNYNNVDPHIHSREGWLARFRVSHPWQSADHWDYWLRLLSWLHSQAMKSTGLMFRGHVIRNKRM